MPDIPQENGDVSKLGDNLDGNKLQTNHSANVTTIKPYSPSVDFRQQFGSTPMLKKVDEWYKGRKLLLKKSSAVKILKTDFSHVTRNFCLMFQR